MITDFMMNVQQSNKAREFELDLRVKYCGDVKEIANMLIALYEIGDYQAFIPDNYKDPYEP